jgi:ADP-ribosyl-[dinitrogen reductase] hydrolase
LGEDRPLEYPEPSSGGGTEPTPPGDPMPNSPSRAERFRGALMGLAVGDALGVPVEGLPAGSHPPVDDMRASPAQGLPAGAWSDDTAMALCLAESLVTRQSFDPRDQMQRYLKWLNQGHRTSTGYAFGIGGTIFRALTRFEETGEPFAGSADPETAGNGCLMRLAPVPMFFAPDAASAMEMASESARTTHGARACLDACRYLGGLIAGALEGVPKAELLAPRYAPVPDAWARRPLCDEVDAVAAGSFLHKEPPAIRATGYVVDTLEAALWALARADDFRSGVLLAVNLGGDADTVGAVYGQLAGAVYGLKGIPKEWRSRVARAHEITELADALAH